MAIHRYGADSPVGRVTLRPCSTGAVRAYLHAGEHATPEVLNALLQPMREGRTIVDKERNWQFIPTELDGQPVLEVRGFGKPNHLLVSLTERGLTKGGKEVTKEPQDKISGSSWIRSQALKLSGFLYITGDISFGLYGFLGKNKDGKRKTDVVIASVFYALGSLMLTFFARDTSTQRLRDVSGLLSEELGKHGIRSDGNTAVGQINDDSRTRPLDRIGNFMRKYHAEGMNLGFAVSGLAQIVGSTKNLAAIKEGTLLKREDRNYVNPNEASFHRNNALMDLGVGIMTTGSSLTTVLTPEKSSEEKARMRAEPTSVVGRAVNWFREQPMRISGYGLSTSTVLHFFSSLRNLKYANSYTKNPEKLVGLHPSKAEDVQEERNSFGFRMIFVVTNLMAELMMTLGHKGHGEGIENDDGVVKSACAMAAELIAQEPSSKQADLLHTASTLLARPSVLGGKAEDYVPLLQAQLAAQNAHPWRMQRTALTAAQPAPSLLAPSLPAQEMSAVREPTPQSYLARAAANRAAQDKQAETADLRAAALMPRQARYAEQHALEKEQAATAEAARQ